MNKNLKTAMTYQFHMSEFEIITIKICVDEKGKTSSWLHIPEITDPDKQWCQMNNKQFKNEFNTYVKNLRDIYHIKSKSVNDDDLDDQLSLEI